MLGPLTPSEMILQVIPQPDFVRGRLSQALREVALLRRLLRLSRQAAKEHKTEKEWTIPGGTLADPFALTGNRGKSRKEDCGAK
ncbi:MAG TPA: hypothetical protein VKU02_24030 [Gemmataceae bacterium]|nr:hypothetical protein [Gemmataceae bacterium]